MMMEVLYVDVKRDLNIKILFYLMIMNVMDALYNGNGLLHMGMYIHAAIL